MYLLTELTWALTLSKLEKVDALRFEESWKFIDDPSLENLYLSERLKYPDIRDLPKIFLFLTRLPENLGSYLKRVLQSQIILLYRIKEIPFKKTIIRIIYIKAGYLDI